MDVSDDVIIYQLEKVNQGGEVFELFEERMEWLAKELGYEYDIEQGIILPDGRIASLEFKAVIEEA